VSGPIRAIGVTAVAVVLFVSSADGQAVSAGGQYQDPQLQALLTLRDSVMSVRREVARFRRDLQFAGARTVMSRARRLSGACEGLQKALRDGAPNLRPAAGASAAERRASDAVQAQIRETTKILDDECRIGLRPDGPGVWSDSLKAWGPYRTSNVEKALSAYEGAAANLAKITDLDFPPNGQ
jgi:hypothetical protein